MPYASSPSYPRLLVTGLALAAGLAACGGGDDETVKSSDVPNEAVAVVGDAKVSRGALEERVEMLRRARPAGSADGPRPATRQIAQEALSALVLEEALTQEAEDRGIEVTDAELQQQWSSIKAQHRGEAALRRYLGGRTKEALLDEIRVQLLTQRIQADVKEKAGGGVKGDRAVYEFQEEFAKRWRDRTACTEDRSVGLCAVEK
ncbi:MAG TPA: SurA N-terminal domain-containing protein [Thermoleophilaceae bacterium]|nr:SurA N-terminal domain-containing protein [Thermoleophilaceae bacterium]